MIIVEIGGKPKDKYRVQEIKTFALPGVSSII
jgi:hypothetical protein